MGELWNMTCGVVWCGVGWGNRQVGEEIHDLQRTEPGASPPRQEHHPVEWSRAGIRHADTIRPDESVSPDATVHVCGLALSGWCRATIFGMDAGDAKQALTANPRAALYHSGKPLLPPATGKRTST